MKTFIASSLFITGIAISSFAAAQASVGQMAPSFEVADASGKTVSLAQYKGKYVVLEWFSPDCPFVGKHYSSGNMQSTQKYAVDKGVVWLAVNTSHETSTKETAGLAEWMASKKGAPSATLIDSGGKMGRAYGARTTPHMYLIDPAGKLAYAGAIDSKPTANPADIKTATNYVIQAIDESLAGKPVSQPVTRPYGCSVKYNWTGLW
jgi:peroxiredoxin